MIYFIKPCVSGWVICFNDQRLPIIIYRTSFERCMVESTIISPWDFNLHVDIQVKHLRHLDLIIIIGLCHKIFAYPFLELLIKLGTLLINRQSIPIWHISNIILLIPRGDTISQMFIKHFHLIFILISLFSYLCETLWYFKKQLRYSMPSTGQPCEKPQSIVPDLACPTLNWFGRLPSHKNQSPSIHLYPGFPLG